MRTFFAPLCFAATFTLLPAAPVAAGGKVNQLSLQQSMNDRDNDARRLPVMS